MRLWEAAVGKEVDAVQHEAGSGAVLGPAARSQLSVPDSLFSVALLLGWVGRPMSPKASKLRSWSQPPRAPLQLAWDPREAGPFPQPKVKKQFRKAGINTFSGFLAEVLEGLGAAAQKCLIWFAGHRIHPGVRGRR